MAAIALHISQCGNYHIDIKTKLAIELPLSKVPVKRRKNPGCPDTGFIVPGDAGHLAA